MLFRDGMYVERSDGPFRLRLVNALTSTAPIPLTITLALRIGRTLERPGLVGRDAENSYLAGDRLEAGLMNQQLGASITNQTAARLQGNHATDAAGERYTL
jgi:hypothetical protein